MASVSKESDDNGVSSTTNELSLTVRLPLRYANGSHGKMGRTRVSHTLMRSYKTISALKDENENLKRKLRTTQKGKNNTTTSM
jgi:hypothetical protein